MYMYVHTYIPVHTYIETVRVDNVSLLTVPEDFSEVLGQLTQQGYRVLAVGHRPLHMAWHKAERVKR